MSIKAPKIAQEDLVKYLTNISPYTINANTKDVQKDCIIFYFETTSNRESGIKRLKEIGVKVKSISKGRLLKGFSYPFYISMKS